MKKYWNEKNLKSISKSFSIKMFLSPNLEIENENICILHII